MQRVSRLTGCLSILGLLAAACGDDTDPKNATTASLHGFWLHMPEDQQGGSPQMTVMAFLPAKEFYSEVGFEVPEGTSGGAVWTTGAAVGPSQVTACEVKDGFLEQTVVFDPVYGAGQSYRTELFEVDKGKSLTTQSALDPSGMRTYKAIERCPIEQESGFARIHTTTCPSYFATGSALAFDPQGRLHYTVGLASPGNNSSCLPEPSYGVLGRACSPARFQVANALSSSLDVFDGKVYHAYEDDDWNVWLRRRGLEDQQWEVLELDKASHGALGIWVFAGERDEVVVSSGYLESQVRWASKEFEPEAPLDEQGNLIVGQIIAASRAPQDGTLGILVSGNSSSGFYVAEEGAVIFRKVELPHSPSIGWGGGLNLLSKTRAYVGVVEGNIGSNPGGVGGTVLGGNGYFMEWNNEEWDVHSVGRSSIVSLPQRTEEKYFVHSTIKSMEPLLYFGRIVDKQVVTLAPTEDVSTPPGGSPEPFRQPAFAVGPNREIAYLFHGEVITLHREDQPWAEPLGITQQR